MPQCIRMLKRTKHYTLPTPGAPRRAPSHPAAGEIKAGGVAITPALPKRAKTRSFPRGYVEDLMRREQSWKSLSASVI